MNTVLYEIYEDIRDWLKFAETKNGALLTFNGALLLCLFQGLIDKFNPVGAVKFLIGISMLLLFLSFFILLISFIPRIPKPNDFQRNKNEKDIRFMNLRFYGDIHTFSPEHYLKAVYNNYLGSNSIPDILNKNELDYATQIIRLSQITLIKYNCFKYSLWLTLISISVLLISFILNVT